MGISRRNFLKVVAVGGGSVLTAHELLEFVAQAEPKGPTSEKGEKTDRGPLPEREGQRWLLGTCGVCPHACGVLGRVVGDRLVHLRGAPFHPLNRGGLCPRGVAGTQLLYHPKRVLHPLKRTGRRGAGEFRPITWDEALAELAAHLPSGGADAMVVAPFARGQVGPLRRAVLPNATFVEHRPHYEVGSPDPGLFLTQGIWGHGAYDLENCDLVLSFDSRLLEHFWRPCETSKVFGLARAAGRCRLIHVESHASATGAKADRWVPIRPGTEALFALGVAHVIIKEGLANLPFIEGRTFGYADWQDGAGKSHEGFRTRILMNYDPRTVADATAVPVDVLINVARAFAAARRPMAIGCDQPGAQGPFTRMAIHCLNALVGSIDQPGGVLVPRTLSVDPLKLPAEKRPIVTDRAAVLAGPAGQDAETLIAGLAQSPKTLIFSEADVVGEAIDRANVERGIAGCEYVVAIATLPDETTAQADLVLPLSTTFERLVDASGHTSGGFPFASVTQAMVKPLGESRSEGDVWFDVAARLKTALPFDGYEALVKGAIKEVYALGTGELFNAKHHEGWLQVLEQSGWRPPAPHDDSSFWDGVLKVGGWWDPVYYNEEWKRVLTTPSGRFEFYSQGLEKLLNDTRPSGVKDIDLVAHPEPLDATNAQFPLALQVFTPHAVGGLASRLSWLRAIAGSHVYQRWDAWVEVAPQTARELKLPHGARAQVRSESGAKIVAVVAINPAAPPGTAAVPEGLLATDTDPTPAANALALLSPLREPLTGRQSRRPVRVTIELL